MPDTMGTVKLFHRHFGGAGNPPLVVLHGLLGSARNWQTVGRELADRFDVYALDLRNHGASPWSAGMSYPEIAGDVVAWLDERGLGAVHLLGHSMGGKTAMRFAMDHPGRLLSLTVVDIAPRDYDFHHRIEFAAMKSLDLATISDRREADTALSATVSDWGMRQFLLTNLNRKDDGSFAWDINLRELSDSLPEISANPLSHAETFAGPTTFVIGGKSTFVRPEDRAHIPRYFPNARLAELPSAGHNPHIDDRAAFVGLIRETLAT
jgi:esterase